MKKIFPHYLITSKENIPDDYYNIKLSESDKISLSKGQETSLLKNIKTPEGETYDCKLLLTKDKDGKIGFVAIKKKQELVIEDSILGNKLSSADIDNLYKKGNFVGPFKSGKAEIFLKIDPELNDYTFRTSRSLGVIKNIGDYNFSDQEKLEFANSGKLNTTSKAICIKTKGVDKYFITSFQISKDENIGTNITYKDPREITKEEYEKLKINNNPSLTEPKSNEILRKNEISIPEWEQLNNNFKSTEQPNLNTLFLAEQQHSNINYFYIQKASDGEEYSKSHSVSNALSLELKNTADKSLSDRNEHPFVTVPKENVCKEYSTDIKIEPNDKAFAASKHLSNSDVFAISLINKESFAKDLNDFSKKGYVPSEAFKDYIRESKFVSEEKKIFTSTICKFDLNVDKSINSINGKDMDQSQLKSKNKEVKRPGDAIERIGNKVTHSM